MRGDIPPAAFHLLMTCQVITHTRPDVAEVRKLRRRRSAERANKLKRGSGRGASLTVMYGK